MTTTEFNVNEIVSNFISDKLDDIFETGKGIFKKSKEDISLSLKTKYKKYLIEVTDKYGKTRSFFFRDEPVPISKFYVPVNLKIDSKIIDGSLFKVISMNRHFIVSGSGGAGKSMLLRSFLIEALKSKYKIPVFIELRDLNDESHEIEDLIVQRLSILKLNFENEFFDKSLQKGHYIFFFDGLDEIKSSIRNKITKSIQEFSLRYSQCDYIISTRPDDRINEFKNFSLIKTLPLNLEQSIQLIEKLPAIEEVKHKFIKDLKDGLFDRHESFLSNPLLLSIMLLTYGYSADIPSKLSIFYNQAYEALFQRHDAYKGAFKRVKETTLDIQEFEKVLCAFCIQSYENKKLKFNKTEAIEYIEKCKAITNLEFNNDGYLTDLLQSICILSQEGLEIVFTHRSFQEYFAAKFIVKIEPEMKRKLIYKYRDKIIEDALYNLIYEMDSSFFEEEVALPFLNHFFKKIGLAKKNSLKAYFNYLNELFSKIYLQTGPSKDENKDLKFWVSVRDRYFYNMTRFILYLINHGINTKYLGNGSKYIDKLIERCIAESSEGIWNVKEFNLTDTMVKELYKSNHWISGKVINDLLEIKNILEKRKEKNKDNLDKILFAKLK